MNTYKIEFILDENQASALEQIANNKGITTTKVLGQITNEVATRLLEQSKVPAKPEPPAETEKDKSHRKRINELSQGMGVSPTAVRRGIMQLSTADAIKKYAISPDALSAFREYIQRTDSPKK